MAKNLPEVVKSAIKNGPSFKYRDWRRVLPKNRTRAEKAMAFGEKYMPLPDGALVGQFVPYIPFQEAIFYQVIDTDAWMTVVSCGRKNAKTQTIADLAAVFILSALAEQNSNIAVASNSREQAAHLFNYLTKSLDQSPELQGLYRVIPSGKTIVGLKRNVTLKCISADARTAHGGQYKVIIFDELAQAGRESPFYDALVTGQGTQAEPKFLILSTQAEEDASLLSVIMDTAIRENSEDVAVHLYAADDECDLDCDKQWLKANPALGHFRSRKDIERQCKEAQAVRSAEQRFRLLILNQRVASDSLWLNPTVWKECGGEPDMDVIRTGPTYVALDLSQRFDLTVAVFAAKDAEGVVHLVPHVFTPAENLKARVMKDKTPYDIWVQDGQLVAVPGEVVDYDFVCDYLRHWTEQNDVVPREIIFDRWRINDFKASAERNGFAQEAEWTECGQGFKDISPRLDSFETALMKRKIRHGLHPVANLAASSAVIEADAAGNRKISKRKSTGNKIDYAISAIMAAYPLLEEREEVFDPMAMIG